MGRLHTVEVSRALPAKFPDRCVICGVQHPGHQARFFAGSQYGALFFAAWLETGTNFVLAPACPSCLLSVRIRNLLRFGVSAACIALATWLLFWVAGGAGRDIVKLKVLGVVVAGYFPVLAWDWLFPASFSLSTDDPNHQFKFHFQDAAYAAEFHALNHRPYPGSLPAVESKVSEKPSPDPPGHSAGFNQADKSLAALGISPAPDRFAETSSFQGDRANPFRNFEDPRFQK